MFTIGFFIPRFFTRIWLFERFGGLAIVLHVLCWIALISLIVGLIRRNRIRKTKAFMHQHQTAGNDPLEIIRSRYAKGEITKDQFDQLKSDLK